MPDSRPTSIVSVPSRSGFCPASVIGIDQIWLINLDRRRDRLERFMQSHPEMSGRINRLPACDGKKIELTPALARLFAPNNFHWHKPTMGCALSHLALWTRLAAEQDDETAWLILEDDAQLAPGWVAAVEKAFISGHVPADWEIIYLGGILPRHRDFFDGNIQPVNRSIACVRPDCRFGENPPGYFHFCAYSYLLSARGARELLSALESWDGFWLQADFVAAYTTPDISPPRRLYFFNPLIARSFQDSASGYAQPYGEGEEISFKVDSDIWKENEQFSDAEVRSLQADVLTLDFPNALAIVFPGTEKQLHADRNGSPLRSLTPSSAPSAIDKIWVINLERRPDRLDKFRENHPDIAGEILMLPAHDGKKLRLTPKLARLFAPNEFGWNKATMGCSLSHLELWYRLAEEPDENARYLILEDDTRLSPGWRETVEEAFSRGDVPADWDVLYLGGILPKNEDVFETCKEQVSGRVNQVVPNGWFGQKPPNRYFHFGAFAYLLSRNGAKKLLEFIRLQNGIWPQADMLLGYVMPESYPIQVAHYFFDPLLAHCYQDVEAGFVKSYSDEKEEGKLDSDIWRESSAFDESLARKMISLENPYDISGALAEARGLPPENGSSATARQKRAGKQFLTIVQAHEVENLDRRDGEDSCIAFCVDKNYFPFTGVAILSLAANGLCNDLSIFIFSENYGEQDIKQFGSLATDTGCRICLVQWDKDGFADLPNWRMSRSTYARLLLPKILGNYRKVLSLDSDILVVGELRDVFDVDMGGACLAAVRDPVAAKFCKMQDFRSGRKPYFNAGLMLIDTAKWIRDGVSEKVIGLAKNDVERERIAAFAEQCLLNHVLDGKFKELGKEYNWLTFDPYKARTEVHLLAPIPSTAELQRVRMLHFAGQYKPWSRECSLLEIRDLYRSFASRSPWSADIFKDSADLAVQVRQTPNPTAVAHRNSGLPTSRWDYVSPNLIRVRPDDGFPNMIVGDVSRVRWPHLRRQIPHTWYCDRRNGSIGFASRDEAAILYNTALLFKGRRCLEIGCWMGWSAAHLLMGGVQLDIIDPVFSTTANLASVQNSLQWVAKHAPPSSRYALHAGCSPDKVRELVAARPQKWAFAFIDGDHEGDGPLRDAQECEQHMEENALVLFHDLSSPFVTRGLDYFRDAGWSTRIYNTMQIMGVAWRGEVTPVEHRGDPRVRWEVPKHLDGYEIADSVFPEES
jgi:lipopolysaccharide biosynthesis glycosyltransferase/GR25 family glycosyltransferase involved in LPS biosynthesis